MFGSLNFYSYLCIQITITLSNNNLKQQSPAMANNMKKLASLSNKEILEFVLTSSVLREKFDTYIYDCEMSYINEKLSCFNRSVDYSLDTYSRNYFKVKNGNEEDFLYSIEKSISMFEASEKLKALVQKCHNVSNNETFKSNIDELCELYYHEELEPIIKNIEACSLAIYNKDITSSIFGYYIECFADNYLNKIYVNSENKLVKLEYLN